MQLLHGEVDSLDIGRNETGRGRLLRDGELYAQGLVIDDIDQGPADQYDATIQQVPVVPVEDSQCAVDDNGGANKTKPNIVVLATALRHIVQRALDQ